MKWSGWRWLITIPVSALGSHALARFGKEPWPISSSSACSPSTRRYDAPMAPGTSVYAGPAPRTISSIGRGRSPADDSQFVADLVERRDGPVQLRVAVRRADDRPDSGL